MKKFIVLLFIIGVFLFIPSAKAIELPEKTDHEKVKLHLFWSSNCPHCHDLMTYFSKRYVNYLDYFEIVTYQTNEGADNFTLLKEVLKYHNRTEKIGVPVVVIGSDYYKMGFGSDGSEIIEEALKAYKDDNYEDLVEKTKKEIDSKAEEKTFVDACNIAKIKCATPNGKKGLSDGVVIGIIMGVLILGFGGLILLSKKK